MDNLAAFLRINHRKNNKAAAGASDLINRFGSLPHFYIEYSDISRISFTSFSISYIVFMHEKLALTQPRSIVPSFSCTDGEQWSPPRVQIPFLSSRPETSEDGKSRTLNASIPPALLV